MWKPGRSKPLPQESPKKPKHEKPKNGILLEESSSATKPISSSKKRLSGGTMNMRFMKRKKETQQYEEKRKLGANDPSISTSSPKSAAMAPVHSDYMGVDNQNTGCFVAATMIDMYGMQASLIGRRSFGGFNPAIEESWKYSKASIENKTIDPKKIVSDEELLQRYQDIVHKRSQSSKPWGI